MNSLDLEKKIYFLEKLLANLEKATFKSLAKKILDVYIQIECLLFRDYPNFLAKTV